MTPAPTLILYANLKGNLGDFAILHAMLVEIEKRHPSHPVHVLSHGQHGIDQARLDAFRKQPHPAFEYLGKTPFIRISRWLSTFKRIGLERWLSGRLIDRFANRYADHDRLKSAGDYDAIYFAGGEQWSGFSNGIAMFSVLSAVSRSNPNIYIFSFSVKKKLLETYSLPRLRLLFGAFSPRLVVRESHSANTMGAIVPSVVLGADSVFSLASVASNLPLPLHPNPKRVILALTTGNGSRFADMEATIRDLATAGYQVSLLTTCEREDGGELQSLSKKHGADYFAPQTWQDAVIAFGEASLVVTNRLHCMIFTLFAKTPLVPLLNREKVVGIFKDAELPHALHHAKELTPERVGAFLDDSDRIRSKMDGYLAKVANSSLVP